MRNARRRKKIGTQPSRPLPAHTHACDTHTHTQPGKTPPTATVLFHPPPPPADPTRPALRDCDPPPPPHPADPTPAAVAPSPPDPCEPVVCCVSVCLRRFSPHGTGRVAVSSLLRRRTRLRDRRGAGVEEDVLERPRVAELRELARHHGDRGRHDEVGLRSGAGHGPDIPQTTGGRLTSLAGPVGSAPVGSCPVGSGGAVGWAGGSGRVGSGRVGERAGPVRWGGVRAV